MKEMGNCLRSFGHLLLLLLNLLASEEIIHTLLAVVRKRW